MSRITAFINFFKNKKKLLAILIIIALVIVGIFIKNRNSKPQDSATVKSGNLKEELVLSGEINATEKTNLFFPVSGKINWIGVNEGDEISKNQTLASLDQSSVVKSLQSTLLDYSKQRNNFEQTKDDNGNGTPATAPNAEIKRILENNQYDLDKAVLAVELKDIAKRDSILTSPFKGIVASKSNYYVGNNITFGTTIFTILNPETIYFSVSADQTEVVSLNIGDDCEITLDAFEGKRIKGVIESISFVPDENESGTVYKVKVSVTGDIPSFRIGMTGDATFIIKEKENALYLPSKFIKSDEKGSYILLGKKKEKKYVKTGLESDESVEIVEGVSKGDIVYD